MVSTQHMDGFFPWQPSPNYHKSQWKIPSTLPTFAQFPSLLNSIWSINQEIYLFAEFLHNNHYTLTSNVKASCSQ
jgi:hypothetical protein